MKHSHHWIIDSAGLGKCKYCPATKQFLQELELKLRPSEITAIGNLADEYRFNPDSWMNASCTDFEDLT